MSLEEGVAAGLVPQPTGVGAVDPVVIAILAVLGFAFVAFAFVYSTGKMQRMCYRGDADQSDTEGAKKKNSRAAHRTQPREFTDYVDPDDDGGDNTDIVEAPPPVPPKPSLPAGWKAKVDKQSGDTYYYNKGTGETSWERPSG